MQKGAGTVGVYKAQNMPYFQHKRLARYNLPNEPLMWLKTAKNSLLEGIMPYPSGYAVSSKGTFPQIYGFHQGRSPYISFLPSILKFR